MRAERPTRLVGWMKNGRQDSDRGECHTPGAGKVCASDKTDRRPWDGKGVLSVYSTLTQQQATDGHAMLPQIRPG